SVGGTPWAGGPGKPIDTTQNDPLTPLLPLPPMDHPDPDLVNVRSLAFVDSFGRTAGPDNPDNSEAFQNALDDRANRGGGIVFVPHGKYQFKGQLKIGANTVLQGSWQSREPLQGQNIDEARATILEVVGTPDEGPGDDPFITFQPQNRGSGDTVLYGGWNQT